MRAVAGIVMGVLSGLMLAGCGGGSEYVPATGTGTTTTTTDANPMVVNTESLAIMRQGDTWMYQWINGTTGTGYYSTHYLSALDATTQRYSQATLFSDDQPAQLLSFGANNALVSRAYENTLCSEDPQTRSPFPRRPWVTGATWTHIWRESCLNGIQASVVDKTISGQIVSASESLTTGLLGQGGTLTGSTAQRTFDTVKYTATRTDTTTAGTWTYTDTCWHDKTQDRTVKCDTHASFVPAGTTASTVEQDLTQRLAFVREVRTASPVAITDGVSTVAVYAGRWKFTFEGSTGGISCPTMIISLTGQVAGSCVQTVSLTGGGTQDVPFAVSGVVARRSVTTQATGEAAVTRIIDRLTVVPVVSTNVFTLSGEMLSPLSAEGTWAGTSSTTTTTTTTSGSSGAWLAQHL
jgi:hypothetical protein